MRASLLGFTLEGEVDGGYLIWGKNKNVWISLPNANNYLYGVGCTLELTTVSKFYDIDKALAYFDEEIGTHD